MRTTPDIANDVLYKGPVRCQCINRIARTGPRKPRQSRQLVDPQCGLRLGQLSVDPKRLSAHHGPARLPRGATASAFHALWSNDISLLDNTRFNHGWIHNHKQLTDVYLLGLAVKNGGRMVTFDQRIALAAVQRAKAERLVVL